jgi:hypothetical protein
MKVNSMRTPLIPQEIFLLERYSSPDYFSKLRDTWSEMILHLDRCLNQFMHNLPLDYRNRPLPEQPDAVWGERVIPNFRDTLQGLNEGYIQLSGGDLSALQYCHGPLNDFKGQTDFWSGWMSRDDQSIYSALLNKAVTMASNVLSTEAAYWDPMMLSSRYDEPSCGPLDAPANWPTYKLVPNISVATGEKLPVSGIYLPDIDDSCAEFLSTEYEIAPEARVYIGEQDLIAPDTGLKYGEEPVYETRPCTWTLVERVNNIGISSAPSLLHPTTERVMAGAQCPQSGFYFTPARQDSRRHFVKGEIMPSFEGAYGATIWQWDSNQA